MAHRFSEAGTFTVTGSFGSPPRTRSVQVKVIGASLESRIATLVDQRRYLDCTNLPPEVVLDGDPRLQIGAVSEEERSLQKPKPKPLGTNGRQLSITNNSAEPRFLVARLGTNGPVLTSAVVEGFRVYHTGETYLRRLEVHDDGSHLIETAIVLSPLLPDVTVRLHIIVAGVCFDDGTLSKVLKASDFDDRGVCRVRFVRSAGVTTSVCHTTKIYQGQTLIGWPTGNQ